MKPKKPKATGGKIIRTVVQALKQLGYPSEKNRISHIICAVSGGADSIALLTLARHYLARRLPTGGVIVAHVDHGWTQESAQVAKRVEARAREWGFPVSILKIAKPLAGESWEASARSGRYEVLNALAEKLEAESGQEVRIWTAHQADDLVETVLWRLMTGAPEAAWGGIAKRWGRVERPLLGVWRSEIDSFLMEEGIGDAEQDVSNQDLRFLRARLRYEIFPVLEKSFPRFRDHLFDIAHSRPILSTTGIVSYPRREKGLGSVDEIFSQDYRSVAGSDSPDGVSLQGRRSRRSTAQRDEVQPVRRTRQRRKS